MGDIDRETRERLRAWMIYFMDQRGEGPSAFARALGVKQPSVSNVRNNKRTMGLDVLLKMSRLCRRSIDILVDTWPPGHATAPDRRPRERTQNPRTASPG